MLEIILKSLINYGALGIVLGYFLWKDREMFNLYKSTMNEIVDELKSMREEQNNIKKEIFHIKQKVGRR